MKKDLEEIQNLDAVKEYQFITQQVDSSMRGEDAVPDAKKE